MTREEIRLQVAISVIQGVLEAKHGVIGEVIPSVAVAIALRIADAFVEEWYRETKEQKSAEWSGDGEIRKAIKCYVEDMPDTYGFAHGIGKKEMLSFLEKQKEQESDDIKREWWNKGYIEGRKNAHLPAKELGLPGSMDYKQEWSEGDKEMLDAVIDMISNSLYEPLCPREGMLSWLKSLCPQPGRNLAVSFMYYLDEHRPEGKMCLSSGECADIETAFKENDWTKVIRYVNKYQPYWKPSEEQMNHLKRCFSHEQHTIGLPNQHVLESLYNDLKKIM